MLLALGREWNICTAAALICQFTPRVKVSAYSRRTKPLTSSCLYLSDSFCSVHHPESCAEPWSRSGECDATQRAVTRGVSDLRLGDIDDGRLSEPSTRTVRRSPVKRPTALPCVRAAAGDVYTAATGPSSLPRRRMMSLSRRNAERKLELIQK